jgi:hypothetical protein
MDGTSIEISLQTFITWSFILISIGGLITVLKIHLSNKTVHLSSDDIATLRKLSTEGFLFKQKDRDLLKNLATMYEEDRKKIETNLEKTERIDMRINNQVNGSIEKLTKEIAEIKDMLRRGK